MDDNYSYISNGAAGYAGMVSVLDLDQSSTCQSIDIPTPQYDLTNYQLEKLTKKGFVTFKQSYTKGIVVTDGVTMAPSDSPFKRLSVTRIFNCVEEVIRAAAEPFIGKQNHLANRNSLQTAIKSALGKLKDKLIERYDFKLIIDPANTKLGIIDIDYTIVPIYEIKEVRNRISVKES
jgi:phage tail sheath protein FI